MRAYYFFTPLKVYQEEQLQFAQPKALISEQGVYRISGENEFAYKAFREARIFRFQMEGQEWQGRLVRESGLDGVHFNLRFLDLKEQQKELLRELTQRQGVKSPWQREFARISAREFAEYTEVPIMAIFQRVSRNMESCVVNYSCNGLMFSFLAGGASIGEGIGQTVSFDLVTSRGRRIEAMEGKIVRLFDEMLAPQRLTRAVGLKFTTPPTQLPQLYRDLIREACHVVVERGVALHPSLK